MTDQMERARLGSHPNLSVQSQPLGLHSPAPASYRRHDRVTRHESEGWRTATPACTPLPHEYPQYEQRRASDPVRVVDRNFTELKRLQHRSVTVRVGKLRAVM